MPEQEISASKAVLVHSTRLLPSDNVLVPGFGTLKYSDKTDTFSDLQTAKSPSAMARHTLHFSISHLVYDHEKSNYENNRIAIVIPIDNLPDDIKSKFIGTPEDTFLFTNYLSLKSLHPTILAPRSMSGEYHRSGLNKKLGNEINCIFYEDKMSLNEAYNLYALNNGMQNIAPYEYVIKGNSNTPAAKYTIS